MSTSSLFFFFPFFYLLGSKFFVTYAPKIFGNIIYHFPSVFTYWYGFGNRLYIKPINDILRTCMDQTGQILSFTVAN